MGFFDKVKERSRDTTREGICARLRVIGVEAEIAERGRAEERITNGLRCGSLGLIDIPERPIRWVNVRRINQGRPRAAHYFLDYGVPDPRLEWVSLSPRIKAVHMRRWLLVAPVVDLRWVGKDVGLGIVSRLLNDPQIKHVIMSSPVVKIYARPDHKCWIISTETQYPPQRELWNCYQAIAQHLLAEWPTESTMK